PRRAAPVSPASTWSCAQGTKLRAASTAPWVSTRPCSCRATTAAAKAARKARCACCACCACRDRCPPHGGRRAWKILRVDNYGDVSPVLGAREALDQKFDEAPHLGRQVLAARVQRIDRHRRRHEI